jgi:hypothetical protein
VTRHRGISIRRATASSAVYVVGFFLMPTSPGVAQGAASAPASASSTAKDSGTASCRKIAARYRSLTAPSPEQSPLERLAKSPGSGVTLAPVLMGFNALEHPGKDLSEWAARQTPPFIVSPGLAGELNDVGTIWQLEKSPGANFYTLSSVAGTANCYNMAYFKVEDGTTVKLAAPPGFADGACGVSRTFGTIDKTSVYFQEEQPISTSTESSLTVATWESDRLTSVCQTRFSFASSVTARAPGLANESCTGDDCAGLREAAKKLAMLAEDDVKTARKQQEAALPASQRADYVVALAKASTDADDVNSGDPTDEIPIHMPLMFHEHLYIASVGHLTLGWRVFPDWSVKLQSLENGKLVERAVFGFEVARGGLRKVTVAPVASRVGDLGR